MKPLVTHLFFVVMLLFFLVYACRPGDKKEPKTEESVLQPQSLTSILSGKLDTLWVADTAFTKLSKKEPVYFSYFLNLEDSTMTLHGWETDKKPNGYEFANNPDIVMANGNESLTSFGPKFYLSPVCLTGKSVEVIKDSITKKGYKFVGFAPTPDGATYFGNLIKYKVLLSKTSPFAPMIMAADSLSGSAAMFYVDPNLDANPSPPKQNY